MRTAGAVLLGSLLFRAVLVVLGAGSSGVGTLAAQVPDSSTQALRGIIEGLPPAVAVRLGIGRERWTGRLARSSLDSLTLSDETRVRNVTLTEIDSLWVRGPRKHEGLRAGVALGAIAFVLLQLNDSGLRGARARDGFFVFVGAATLGVLMDGISDPWVTQYPE